MLKFKANINGEDVIVQVQPQLGYQVRKLGGNDSYFIVNVNLSTMRGTVMGKDSSGDVFTEPADFAHDWWELDMPINLLQKTKDQVRAVMATINTLRKLDLLPAAKKVEDIETIYHLIVPQIREALWSD